MYFSQDALSELPKRIVEGSTLWPRKHNWEQMNTIANADPFVHSSQYQQSPAPLTGGIFNVDKFVMYNELPAKMPIVRMYCDTAQKTKEHNDYSVLQIWGLSPGNGIYLLDQKRGKWKAPMLEQNLKEFWAKYRFDISRNWGCQMVKIEDKSSGSSLIQNLEHENCIPVEGIQRHVDKYFRAYGVVSFINQGYVHLPAGMSWITDYKDEFKDFTPLGTHAHDDQIDPTMDAIEDLIVRNPFLYSDDALS